MDTPFLGNGPGGDEVLQNTGRTPMHLSDHLSLCLSVGRKMMHDQSLFITVFRRLYVRPYVPLLRPLRGSEAGPGLSKASLGPSEAGPGLSEAGSGLSEAGSGLSEAGPGLYENSPGLLEASPGVKDG